jgi:hypothetical protein
VPAAAGPSAVPPSEKKTLTPTVSRRACTAGARRHANDARHQPRATPSVWGSTPNTCMIGPPMPRSTTMTMRMRLDSSRNSDPMSRSARTIGAIDPDWTNRSVVTEREFGSTCRNPFTSSLDMPMPCPSNRRDRFTPSPAIKARGASSLASRYVQSPAITMIAPMTRSSSSSESETISRLCQISRILGCAETSGVWKATSADLSALEIVFLTEDLKGLAKRCWRNQLAGFGTCDGAAAAWAGPAGVASAGESAVLRTRSTRREIRTAAPSARTRDWFGWV